MSLSKLKKYFGAIDINTLKTSLGYGKKILNFARSIDELADKSKK